MAVIAYQLKKKASTYCMETEGFTTITNSLPSGLFMRPYERWAFLGVFVLVYVRCLKAYVRPKHGFDTVGFVHRSDLRKKNCKIQNSLHKIKKKTRTLLTLNCNKIYLL